MRFRKIHQHCQAGPILKGVLGVGQGQQLLCCRHVYGIGVDRSHRFRDIESDVGAVSADGTESSQQKAGGVDP